MSGTAFSREEASLSTIKSCGETPDAFPAKAGPTKRLAVGHWYVRVKTGARRRILSESRYIPSLMNFPARWRKKLRCVLSTSVHKGIG